MNQLLKASKANILIKLQDTSTFRLLLGLTSIFKLSKIKYNT